MKNTRAKLRRLSRACFKVAEDIRSGISIPCGGGQVGSCALQLIAQELGVKCIYHHWSISKIIASACIWSENDGDPTTGFKSRSESFGQGPPVGYQNRDGMADILVVAGCALESEAEDLKGGQNVSSA